MPEQAGRTIYFYFAFVASKQGKTGLSPTYYIVERSTGDVVVDGATATAVNATKLPGLYVGSYTTLAGDDSDFLAMAHTADTTVDSQDIYALQQVGMPWVERLDAAISSRAAPGDAMDLVAGAVDATAIADNAIDAGAIATGAITAAKFAAGAIDADALAADAVTEIAAEVWAYSPRTLTEVLVSTDNTNPANTLTARRGDYYSKSLTDLGNITAYTKLWLDVKETEDGLQPDDDALVQIVVGSGFATTGLIYLNGDTASNNAWGSLTVDDAATADITIVLEADATVLLPPGRYYYGLKALVSGNPTTLVSGVFIVLPGYTTAVS